MSRQREWILSVVLPAAATALGAVAVWQRAAEPQGADRGGAEARLYVQGLRDALFWIAAAGIPLCAGVRSLVAAERRPGRAAGIFVVAAVACVVLYAAAPFESWWHFVPFALAVGVAFYGWSLTWVEALLLASERSPPNGRAPITVAVCAWWLVTLGVQSVFLWMLMFVE